MYLEEECSEHLEHLVYLDGARDALLGEPISALNKGLNVLVALIEALDALGVLGVLVPCTTAARGVLVCSSE